MRVNTVKKIEKTSQFVQKIIDQTFFLNFTKNQKKNDIEDNNLFIQSDDSRKLKKDFEIYANDSDNENEKSFEKEGTIKEIDSESEDEFNDEELDNVKEIQNSLKSKIVDKKSSLHIKRMSCISYMTDDSIM